MEFLSQYGMFALKSLTLVFSILILVGGVLSLTRQIKPKLSIVSLNKETDETEKLMHKTIIGKKSPKKKKDKVVKPILYVLDFAGDIKASQVEQLRHEISAVLTLATPADEVVLRLESPGGSVNGYGLAASQLQRIRDKHIPLTVCIDKVAASGGYLMACIANKIIAAPFSIIGSIGVVAQMPNFHRLLEKNNIDVEILTAGEYKRTLTLFGKNTDKGRQKFQEDIEHIHVNFKDHVLANRSQLDINAVSTGEHWLAKDALNLHLVDALQTSDAYLTHKMATHQLFKLEMHRKPTLINKLMKPAMAFLHPWA